MRLEKTAGHLCFFYFFAAFLLLPPQIENLKSHQADRDKLSAVDQFYLQLLDVPRSARGVGVGRGTAVAVK